MSTFTGQVSTLHGLVRAINPETGEVRILEQGSPIFVGEVVVTSEAGGIMISMENGEQLTLGRNTQMLIDGDVADKASAADAETESAVDIAALQQAVL
ncbi:MAG: retention module-containing protein, partial [Thiomicrorhabdus sp.]|nr:retention module-containing protein [Thiomicrorhabdus sp.]